MKLLLIGLFAMTAIGVTGCAADTSSDDEPTGEAV